jgi:hypothetical protein
MNDNIQDGFISRNFYFDTGMRLFLRWVRRCAQPPPGRRVAPAALDKRYRCAYVPTASGTRGAPSGVCRDTFHAIPVLR